RVSAGAPSGSHFGMRELNPLRHLARAAPKPLDGLLAVAANVTSDFATVANGLRGDDAEEWDSEYIRRTLPIMSTLFRTYFRGEVRGLDNIPDGPSLLVGNHSGGTMIADTFVFTVCF